MTGSKGTTQSGLLRERTRSRRALYRLALTPISFPSSSPSTKSNMDNMVPDPSPALPPSIPEIQAQIDHLEAAHKAKGFPLSGRIIHVCHHLPVEITRVLPRPHTGNDTASQSVEGSPRPETDAFSISRGSFSAGGSTAGVLSPPRIPEFKEPDSVSRVAEDLSWKLASRRGHTAMISGMRSLSSTHEQVVVAWTGDIMQEYTDQQHVERQGTPPAAAKSRVPGGSTPSKKMPAMQRTYSVAGTAPGEESPSQGSLQAAAPAMQQPAIDDGRPSLPQSNMQHAVYLPELTSQEKQGLEAELEKFSAYEVGKGEAGKMSYVPVFVPREEARGHYEGYCKTSEYPPLFLPVTGRTADERAPPQALWPLFHYLLWQDSPVPTPSPDPMWMHYQATNKLFAERVAQIYKPGDLIIVHDYHLLLVPKMIREYLGQHSAEVESHGEKVVVPDASVAPALAEDAREPATKSGKVTSPVPLGNLGGEPREQGEIAIGMFIHTPWPSSEIYRCLPKRKEILDGMLGANLVCFQVRTAGVFRIDGWVLTSLPRPTRTLGTLPLPASASTATNPPRAESTPTVKSPPSPTAPSVSMPTGSCMTVTERASTPRFRRFGPCTRTRRSSSAGKNSMSPRASTTSCRRLKSSSRRIPSGAAR